MEIKINEKVATRIGHDRILSAVFVTVLASAGLYLGRIIFEPIAFVLFTMALVEPFRKTIEARAGKTIALTLTILLTLLVLSILVLAIVWSIGEVLHWGMANADRFQSLYLRVRQSLEERDISIAEFSNLSASSFVGVLLFLAFGLAEMDEFRIKIATLDKQMSGWSLLETSGRIANKIRKYMLIRTLASAATGLAVFLFTLAIGLDLAVAWGVISFVLNYIPYVGSLIAVVLPVIFSTAQFESWQMAAIIFGSLYLIQFVIGSYLEPMLTGSALAISPFVMLFAFMTWDFLWGMPGAFIGIPVTIALFTVWEQNPSTRWIANLMATSATSSAD
jgi:AI-2 transport protein TqsA